MSTDESHAPGNRQPRVEGTGGQDGAAQFEDGLGLDVGLGPEQHHIGNDFLHGEEESAEYGGKFDDETVAPRRPNRRSGVRAVDGARETVGDEIDAEEDDEADLEPEKRSVSGDAWPVLSFDISVLVDPDTDPVRHEAEWRRVYEHFDPFLRYYFEDVMRYRDADEIAAAVWRRALRSIGSLDEAENAWWWLIRIGRNYHTDERRKEVRQLSRDRKGLDQATDDAPDDWRDRLLDEIAGERLFNDQIDREAFRRAFDQLTDRDKEFAYLLKVEELSHEELVARLRLTSVEASRQRWRWIKKKLSLALGIE